MADVLTVDLHPVFRSDRDIDNAIRQALFRGKQQGVSRVEFIPGRGSGQLKSRVLAILRQPHLRKLYRSVEADPANEGRVLVQL